MTIPSQVWIRNAIFTVGIIGALGLAASWLLRPDPGPSLSTSPAPTDIGDAARQVDAAFAKAWLDHGVEPARTAPDLLVARRLALGLAGTIPSLEEVRALEALPEAERIDWWCRRLLEDPRTSDYLAERFARALVGVEPGPFLVYRRRRFVSWLSEQFQANTPWDQLVRDLITAQGTWTSSPESNFITVTIDQNDKSGPSEIKLAGRLTRAFLGVRLDCVECHDDFLHDKWKQQDFHQLASFFGPASSGLSGVRDEDKPYHYTMRRSDGEAEIPSAVPFLPDLLPTEGPLRERLAGWVTDPGNRPFARSAVNRMWALLCGQPLTSPVDEIPLEAPFPPGIEALVDDFIGHGYDLHRLVRVIVATEVYRRHSQSAAEEPHVTPEQETHWAAFRLTRLRPEQVGGALLQAASLETLDADAHIIKRLTRSFSQKAFLERYGDVGEDEFADDGGSIPQRLVLMNGDLIEERTKDNLFMNAATRLAVLTDDDLAAIEGAYLAVLTRRPTAEETAYFAGRLEGVKGPQRTASLQDLYWALLNSTEFAWGH